MKMASRLTDLISLITNKLPSLITNKLHVQHTFSSH